MKSMVLFSLFFHLFKIINSNKTKILYRCGVDEEKFIPIPAMNYTQVNKEKRKLDFQIYGDFNIYLDLINIKKEIKKYKLEKYEDLFVSSLNKGVETLKSLLKVKKLNKNFKFSDEDIINIGIEDWDKTLYGSNVQDGLNSFDIDLIILGRFDDKMHNLTLAFAGAKYVDPDTGQPIVGLININPKIDYSKINSKEFFKSVVLHEFTHILGFSSSHFSQYLNIIFSKNDKQGIMHYYIKSPKVLEVAKKYFNCSSIDGVELEDFSGEGTAGSHWEARILLGEYMNGVLYPEEQVISEFTLSLLEDTGYYKANYYTGGLMRYGKGKGCDFINNKCVNSNHEINPLFENEFYDSIYSQYLFDASCSSGRQSRTYYAWWKYDDLPERYQYFTNKQYGGFGPADYCPVSKEDNSESKIAYFTGHCSLKGNGGYGTQIKYETITNGKKSMNSYTNSELKQFTGETNSDHSFCYQSSLFKSGTSFDTSVIRSICYETFCSDKSLTIKIQEDYFVCPRAGGKVKVEGYDGYFMCPDYNLICSGTVLCNDMFDCVEKKSKTKEESYINDYISKTTQNPEAIEIMSFDEINNYELSDNGKCIINCQHCTVNNKCMNCRSDYGLIISNDNNELICVPNSGLNIGYYISDNIYYKCIDKCEKCSNNTYCDKCIEGYTFVTDKCIIEIKNCKIYGKDSLCDECNNHFGLKDNNRTLCLRNKELFIIQIQIINKFLKVYFIVSEKIDEEIIIKVSIDIYKKTNIRNIEEDNKFETQEINLIINDNITIEPGKIFELSSEEQINDLNRIVLKQNLEKNSLFEMKLLNNDKKILDTEENKKMIQNGDFPDFSKKINANYEINEHSKQLINYKAQNCD